MISDQSSLNSNLTFPKYGRKECDCSNKNEFSKSSSLSSRSDETSSLKMNYLNQSNNQINDFNQLNNQMSRQISSELDLHFDDYEQFYVPIDGYEILDKRTKFTVYKLKVENIRSGLYWFVYRRFTDFQRLNAKLKSKYPNLELNLPSKSFFDNVFNPIYIEKRQLGLQLYLNGLMSNKELLKESNVRKFLCIEDPPISNNSSTLIYPSSIYSTSCDQLFCNNCYALEKKLDELQIVLRNKEAKIKKLEMDLESKSSLNSD